MLSTLRIKNLALVPDLTLELGPGLNVISGETGAGKSILIGALNLVLGERADRTLIRSGTETCLVEAVFDLGQVRAPVPEFLEENGLEPCEENQLLLKRSFTVSGTNRQFVNGSPTTLALLRRIGDWLVDIHGPHDHQSLLHPARQLNILDAFGNLQKLRLQFAGLATRQSALAREKTALIVDEKTYAQQLDLLRFQVQEIQSARLDPEEEAPLHQDHQRAGNRAQILELTQVCVQMLDGEEGSLMDQAGHLGRHLQQLQSLDPALEELLEQQAQAVQFWQDMQRSLATYQDGIDIDPARLEEIEERLNLIQGLKRKYGSTIEEINTFGHETARQLEQLESRDETLAGIDAALKKVRTEMKDVGRELTQSRKKIIPKLAKAVTLQLNDLGFKQSRFDVALTTRQDLSAPSASPANTGFDTVEFQFGPNPGEPTRDLRAIASSGEMARVMLAIKTVLAAEDEVPVLVFDEVDANVGGETARVVGQKMKQIAGNRQVFCVTHLAPVAAHAQTHFQVSKRVDQGRTTSVIQELEADSRLTELARMLGGDKAAARKLAQAMVQEARKMKGKKS